MKKIILTSLLMSIAMWAISQTIVTTTPQYKTAVLEEFTGIHCTYCPDGHKRAKELKSDYPGRVILVNVHVGGYAVPSGNEPDFRTPYGTAIDNMVGVSGYPAGTVNRAIFPALNNTMELNRGQWRAAAEDEMQDIAPVNIGATTSYNPSTREITINVEAYYTSNAANGNYNLLNIALLQDSLEGPQTGGSTYNPGDILPNGKYNHDHMLRDFVTGQWGDSIKTTTAGSVYTYSVVYTIPNNVNGVVVNPDHCELALYITNTNKDVLNGITVPIDNGNNNGNTAPNYGNFNNLNAAVLQGANPGVSNFTFDFTSTFTNAQDFVFELTTDAPQDWSADYTVAGNTYTTKDTITLAGSTAINMGVNVTPGTTKKVAKYTLSTWPISDTTNKTSQDVYVIYGITDLIVAGSGDWGDGGAHNFDQVFLDGLAHASNTAYDITSAYVMKEAQNAGALTGVNNIYYNVAWTFPSFYDDEATALMAFMTAGGNVFVAGQDIGWEINDSQSGYGTPTTQNLYNNYFNATFVNDGNTSNSTLVAETTDAVFNSVATGNISDVYGNSNVYPDQITPKNGAMEIFHYTSASKKAGLRYTNGTYKLVYVGVGMEMIPSAVSKEIIKLSHDWFYGLVSAEQLDALGAGITVYPNPSNGVYNIELTTEGNYQVSVVNVLGEEVMNFNINAPSKKQFNIHEFSNGVYFVKLNNGTETIVRKIIKE